MAVKSNVAIRKIRNGGKQKSNTNNTNDNFFLNVSLYP
jgi:hypothetical protein